MDSREFGSTVIKFMQKRRYMGHLESSLKTQKSRKQTGHYLEKCGQMKIYLNQISNYMITTKN